MAGPRGKKPEARKAGRRALFIVLPATLALLLLAFLLLRLFGGTAQQSARVGGAFRLTAGNGDIVTQRSFPGKYKLIYFGYTSCPDVCPIALADIAAALADLGPRAARVQALFITVDPKRDTPALMRKYVRQFSPAILGLTGSAAAIEAVEREYRVSVAIVPGPAGQGGYTIEHSAALYLMAPDGSFVTAFQAEESGAALAAAIGKIVS
ncbi:MAG TPA: SCO family protein [Acetobacteraceae bacterium]|nr:SCO family protein [Acetobacteraceae bacterium]